MRLYYFTGPEFALSNIENRHLKMSFSNEVNDLFELRPFKFRDRDDRKRWSSMVEQWSMENGFVSFTSHWSIPTMWAHYADSHRGVCYGFDVDLPARQIVYCRELKKFDRDAFTDQTVADSEFSYASSSKSKHWEYEREWRTYYSLSQEQIKARGKKRLLFVPFSSVLNLKEVIIGAKSSIKSREIKDLLRGGSEVRVQTARAAFESYAMVGQRWERLQR